MTLACLADASATGRITAKLDSAGIIMGAKTKMLLEVVQQRGSKGQFPLLQGHNGNGIAGVCGDSVEFSGPMVMDTVELGSGKIQINCSFNVQSFDSGYYKLPELAFVVGNDTLWSNSTYLKVTPVQVTAEDPISGFAPVVKPEGARWTDSLPDFIYYYWWVILLVLTAAAGAVWVLLRRKKGVPVIPAKAKPQISPSEAALRALADLRQRKLWERGLEKDYFTELTEILRQYLDRQFSINAMEMTSRQIMQTLASNPEIKDKRQLVRQILDMADFVKFAKVRPLPADSVAAYDNAVSFVKETAPATEEEGKIVKDRSKKGGEA